jgi:hypothetical protein
MRRIRLVEAALDTRSEERVERGALARLLGAHHRHGGILHHQATEPVERHGDPKEVEDHPLVLGVDKLEEMVLVTYLKGAQSQIELLNEGDPRMLIKCSEYLAPVLWFA